MYHCDLHLDITYYASRLSCFFKHAKNVSVVSDTSKRRGSTINQTFRRRGAVITEKHKREWWCVDDDDASRMMYGGAEIKRGVPPNPDIDFIGE